MDFLEKRAEETEESGDLETARRLWKELAEQTQNPVFFCRYGRTAQKLEDWQESENALLRALHLDSSFALAMEGLGDLWATRTDKEESECLRAAQHWFPEALKHDRTARTLTFLGNTHAACLPLTGNILSMQSWVQQCSEADDA